MAVDETKVSVEDDEVYVWAAVDMDTFEVVHIEVSPGRSDLDALLFLKAVLKRCRGQPVIVVDRGPWDNWALNDLDLCESRRETWGNGHLSKPGSACSTIEPGSSTVGSLTTALGNLSIAGPKPSPLSTMPSLNLDTLKRGGPIAGCRAVYASGTDYAIIYENEPDCLLPSQTDQIEKVHFYGIKKHDNQADARTGTEEPLISIFQFELEVPAGKAAERHSAFHDAEGVYPDDSETEWGDSAVFRGEYEGQHEDLFNAIASDGEILERDRRPLEEFLEDP